MRPHFEIPVSDDGPAVLAHLNDLLAEPDAPFMGQVLTQHAYLRLPYDQRTMLSPNLDLELLTDADGETVLHGRFSPHPSVWTGFIAIFATLGMIGLGGLFYGLAQLTVQETPWAMLAAPISLALIAFVYGGAFIGQGLSTDQMYALRAFVEGVGREVGERSGSAAFAPD
jgi:hypothetical protein